MPVDGYVGNSAMECNNASLGLILFWHVPLLKVLMTNMATFEAINCPETDIWVTLAWSVIMPV